MVLQYRRRNSGSRAELEMSASFRRVHRLGYMAMMTVSEMLETMYESDLFDMFPEFSNVVHILAVVPATSCCAPPFSSYTVRRARFFEDINVFIFAFQKCDHY